MIDYERPPVLTDEQVYLFGVDAYERYSADAKDSAVPASFLRYSDALTLDHYQELPSVDVIEIIFETKFEDDNQAWLALKYADAMATIKTFNSATQYDSEGPIVHPADLKQMYLIIGIAAVNEFQDDRSEAVKQRVEDYFDTHPQAMFRLDFLVKQAEKGLIH